jgi:nitrite reductase (NADH) small subunit
MQTSVVRHGLVMEVVLQTIRVGNVSDFEDPGKIIVAVDDEEYGVFKLNGAFFAWKNECPHQGGPVCQGRFVRQVIEVIADDKTSHGRDYEPDGAKPGRTNIVCPWHGMEFDIRTGVFPGNADMALQGAAVQVQGDEVFVTV